MLKNTSRYRNYGINSKDDLTCLIGKIEKLAEELEVRQ